MMVPAPELPWVFADRWENSELNCTAVISLSQLFWKPLPGRRCSQLSHSWVGSSSATSALLGWHFLSVILQSCLLRLPLASGRWRDLTHVCVGFDRMLFFFC